MKAFSNIVDYTTQKLFDNKLTSSAILFCEKNCAEDTFVYTDSVNNVSFQLRKTDLIQKWTFNYRQIRERVLGDYFQVSSSIATLLNKAYIIKQLEHDPNNPDLAIINGCQVEMNCIRPAASPRSLSLDLDEWIIFGELIDSRVHDSQNIGLHYDKIKNKSTAYYRTFEQIYNKKCAYCGVNTSIQPTALFELDHFVNKNQKQLPNSKSVHHIPMIAAIQLIKCILSFYHCATSMSNLVLAV